jgi:hypothetical protein
MFRADASAITLSGVKGLIGKGVLFAIGTLWVVTMHALVALGALAGAVVYALAVPLAWRVLRRDGTVQSSG